jgi:hypothetical protein
MEGERSKGHGWDAREVGAPQGGVPGWLCAASLLLLCVICVVREVEDRKKREKEKKRKEIENFLNLEILGRKIKDNLWT